MTLNTPEQTAEKLAFQQENAEKCIFPHQTKKRAFSFRKMRFSRALGRKPKEIAGGCQGSMREIGAISSLVSFSSSVSLTLGIFP